MSVYVNLNLVGKSRMYVLPLLFVIHAMLAGLYLDSDLLGLLDTEDPQGG